MKNIKRELKIQKQKNNNYCKNYKILIKLKNKKFLNYKVSKICKLYPKLNNNNLKTRIKNKYKSKIANKISMNKI